MKLKTTRKIIKILLVVFSGSLLACNSTNKPKKVLTPYTKASIMYRNVSFESQGTTLRGRLYNQQNSSSKSPLVIMSHGFTTTINGMTADKYAEKFYQSGYSVLLYDHHNLGDSDGEPRQEVNFWVQSREYIDAIDFSHNLHEIDTNKIAIWGCSMSAEEVFLVGAIDERVKAIVSLVPSFGDVMPSKNQDNTIYEFAKNMVLKDSIMNFCETKMEQTLVVTTDPKGSPAAIDRLTAYNWFITYGGRYRTGWKNLVSWSDTDRPPNYHVANFSPHLKAPILAIIATEDEMPYSDYKVALEVFNRITQSKEWVDIDGGHFGHLYYPSELFEKSSQAQIDFLNKHLNQD